MDYDKNTPLKQQEQPNIQTCKICLEDSSLKHGKGNLIEPCMCSGSCSFVHEECLKSWIRAKHQNIKYPSCEICLHHYNQELQIGLKLNISRAFAERCSQSKRMLFLVIILILSMIGLIVFIADIIVTKVANSTLITDKESVRVVSIFLFITMTVGLFMAIKQSCIRVCYFESIVKWKLFSKTTDLKPKQSFRRISTTVHPIRLPAGSISTNPLVTQSVDASLVNNSITMQASGNMNVTIEVAHDASIFDETMIRNQQSFCEQTGSSQVENITHTNICKNADQLSKQIPEVARDEEDDEERANSDEERQWKMQYSCVLQIDMTPTHQMNLSQSAQKMMQLYGYTLPHKNLAIFTQKIQVKKKEPTSRLVNQRCGSVGLMKKSASARFLHQSMRTDDENYGLKDLNKTTQKQFKNNEEGRKSQVLRSRSLDLSCCMHYDSV